MFNVFRRRPSQISSIMETGINVLVAERNANLAEMNRLEKIIHDAQKSFDQHTRLYEALNNTLFNINHPFDPLTAELAADIDADLSVDQPSDGERIDAFHAPQIDDPRLPLAPAPLDMPIPFRGRGTKRGNTEQAQ